MSDQQKIVLLKQAAYVGGSWVGSDQKERIEVLNPSDQSVVGSVPDMGAQDVTSAVESAEKALPEWSGMLATERQGVLEKWYDLIVENIDELVQILTLEQGKPHKEARGEILNGASFIKWYAEEGRRVYGDVIPPSAGNQRIVVLKQPVGVCAMITPWNFPSSMITRKAAAALAAGCPVIIKPSELTPFSALALAELADQAGFPKGVFNVVTGDAAIVGDVLTKHEDIKKFSFTGSTRVGKMLMAQCASTVKKVSMELGGNAPFIVFEDADIEAAVDGVIASKFRNVGQTCICANRIFVHTRIFDDFIKRFVEKTKALKIGDGRDDKTDIGPMIYEKAVENTLDLVKDALDKGAKLHCGGDARKDMGPQFIEPTVISDVNDTMRCFNEEIFGPLAAVYVFESVQDVVKQANDTEYGLAAYIYTNDLKTSWEVAEKLEYGMVGVNSSLLSTAQAPFGGVKHSGMGREGSKYGLDDYIVTKYMSVQF
jgi:succinate-semialdehyde dehydrogenase/glutarate-semialdehyde dehydrogenase